MTPLASDGLCEYFRDEWPIRRFSALELQDLAGRGVVVARQELQRRITGGTNEGLPQRNDDEGGGAGVPELRPSAGPVQVGPPLDRVEQTAAPVSERECDPEPSVIAARASAVRQARQPRKRVA
jgi:hypothetical protein